MEARNRVIPAEEAAKDEGPSDWPTYLDKESHDLVLQATSPADQANTEIKKTFFSRPVGPFFYYHLFYFIFLGGKHCFCFSLFFFKVPIKAEV